MTREERRILCPGCGTQIPVPWDTQEGVLIECDNCAGVMFQLCVEDGREVLRLVQLVSVPSSDDRIPVDDDTLEGSVIEHDGNRYKLTKEFGAFSLEIVET